MDEKKRHPVRGACCAIKAKLASFLDLNEAGLPRMHPFYRNVLESATKIVKEFKNQNLYLLIYS